MNFLACDWDTTQYLVFSQNVFDPLIYYSHLGPFVASLTLFLFIFFANREDYLNKLLLFLIFLFCAWSIFDLYLWASDKGENIMFVWSILIFLEILIYATSLYFVYYFIQKKDFPLSIKAGLILLIAPIILLVATQYNLQYFDLTNCEREASEGMLWGYTYYVEALFAVLILAQLLYVLFSKRFIGRKKEIALICLGILAFLIFFSWGNIVGSITGDWSIGQYGLFGMPIFIAFLGYSIVKYQVLNVKALAVQVLVAAIVIMIGAQLFFVKTPLVQALTFFTLLCVLVFGIMLIRSMKKEIESKEQFKMLSLNLEKANQRLEELDKQKSEFISIASHQLRTPLTAIRGYISLALEGSYGEIGNTEITDIFHKIYTIDLRLSQLVEDLLNVSKIEAGKVQYKWEEVALEPIVRELYDMFIALAHKKGLSLDFKAPEAALPTMTLDVNKIKEIVSNLIDNAIKYTEKGGVTISIESTPTVARVVIADTGIGIAPEDAAKLFQKFIRTETTKMMDAGGSGLGLFVGKSFVEAHGGRVYVTSEGVGKGSQFIIELPLINPNKNL
jgi:signal transduction histidine kinase